MVEDCREGVLYDFGVCGRDASVAPLEQKDGLVPWDSSLFGGNVMPKRVACPLRIVLSSIFWVCIARSMKKVPWKTIVTAHITSPAIRSPACASERSFCLTINQTRAAPATARATALKPAPVPGSSQASWCETDLRLLVKMRARYATQPSAMICSEKATKRSALNGARCSTSGISAARATSTTELPIVEIAVALAAIHTASSSLMSGSLLLYSARSTARFLVGLGLSSEELSGQSLSRCWT